MFDDEDFHVSRGTVAKTVVRIVLVVFGLVALVAVIVIGWNRIVYPELIAGERKANVESQQYVDSQVTFMLQKVSAIEELRAEVAELEAAEEPNQEPIAAKESQIKAFTREVRERAALIDESAVPQPIKDYLEEVEAEKESTE